MDENIERTEGTSGEVVTPEGAAEQTAKGEQTGVASGQQEEKQQSHEDNRRYQAARRKGEEEGYARAKREFEERISRSGMRNQNGETIRDIEGLESMGDAFRKQRAQEIAKKTGRSAEEVEEEERNREFITSQRLEAEEKRKKERDGDDKDRARQDMEDFLAEYPEVNVKELLKDDSFTRFCRNDLGVVPLKELYKDYLAFDGNKKADNKAWQDYYSQMASMAEKEYEQSLTRARERAETMAKNGDMQGYLDLGYSKDEAAYLVDLWYVGHPEFQGLWETYFA